MRVGIVGPELSGKTTLFNALTGLGVETGPGSGQARQGVIRVPDERLDHLASVVRPKKTTHADLHFVDVGHAEKTEWTVASWKADQGLEHQEELEKGFHEIVSHPWFIGGQRQLDPKRMEMFYTACYDLDTFRRFVTTTTFAERFELEDGLLEQLETDDEALLRFAFRWLRFALFAEPTMKVTDASTKKATGGTVEE